MPHRLLFYPPFLALFSFRGKLNYQSPFTMSSKTLTTKAQVLLLSLSHEDCFDETYADLMNALLDKATMQRIKTPDSALKKLTANGGARPIAILITDTGMINQPRNAPVWDAVLTYVRSGGTAVLMGHFALWAQDARVAPFFKNAGLSWDAGAYLSTDTVLNQTAIGEVLAKRLPLKYSQKAHFLTNVAAEEIWYASEPDSVNHLLVDGAESASKHEAAAALAKVGEGKLGYLGDVNGEEETFTIVLAMCGLL